MSVRLSAPVASLPEVLQAEFRTQLVALPADRAERRPLSAAMVEALAAARRFGGGIAVSRNDVGPNLRAASEADGIAFHIL